MDMATTTAILTVQIEGRDEDGVRVVTTVAITADDDGEFLVTQQQDGESIDCQACETLAEAEALAEEWAATIRHNYKAQELERIKAQREHAREALMGVAEELEGDAARAVRALARLLGKGKVSEALAALKAVK
jgi:hypothetical protein